MYVDFVALHTIARQKGQAIDYWKELEILYTSINPLFSESKNMEPNN